MIFIFFICLPARNHPTIYGAHVIYVSLIEDHMEWSQCIVHLLLDSQSDSYTLDIYPKDWASQIGPYSNLKFYKFYE